MPYAIYFEFAGGDEVYQGLFIPSTPLSSYWIKPTYCYKELSPARSRRTWQVKVNPAFVPSTVIPRDTTELMRNEIQQLDGLHVYITSVLIGTRWTSVGNFPIEVTSSDLLALKENETRMPATLSARIKEKRLEMGFAPLPGADS